MSALSLTPRLAILAVTGATALSVAALAAPAPAYAQGDRVFGPVASVSGNTFQVTAADGPATVQLTDSTTVSEAVPAQLSDVTVGSCITAAPTPESAPADSGAITAKWVMVSTAVGGKCPQRGGQGGTPPPAPAQHRGVRGVVNAVAGSTVTVTRTDADGNTSPATVTTTDATHYRKRVTAGPQAITQGKCAAARGANDANGVLQATNVTVWTSTEGGCPQPPH
ncbi:MAG TPA: DUF5666 domain-containing protein [Mycobacterium sp.]|nr:DUF5666 domain-containing protein [Mycobacterium sp.]